MKFGTFVFPVVPNPANDGQGIQDALTEARVSEELGMDAVWVAEHHFDGNCV
jgi:alkanesulfonate monooxygenase SsuD/methylene tetrahydromethanopterin reductase-like flavin-dependent oxidoreductase (luciferase family)